MARNLPTGGNPLTTNVDLAYERTRATFDPLIITNLLDGSPAATKRRRQLEALIRNDPTKIFCNEGNAYLHRTDRHVRALAKHVRLIELCRSIGIGSKTDGEVVLDEDWFTLLAAVADDLPTSLHWIMFVPNIISLCDEEQKKQWLPMCRDWRMIGCYAQTEVGHGSNVRGLETTATYVKEGANCKGGDVEGGSWIINSPTLTSIKFWPGSLGRTCNHAMVIARLIDGDGVDRGVHNFLVQTRSLQDHSLMPGVTCGDIGPKIGYNNMDNGFAKFDNVIIPRRNMAMRFATVRENGTYEKMTVSDAASKISYITMMQVRSLIVMEAGRHLRMGTTMAIRYSAVRRQGFKSSTSKEENQILDYKQQQHRIFPLLAASYCFFFTSRKVTANLKAIEERLMKISDDDNETTITKTEVGDIHASTSSLKSFCTTIAADGIEDCRKACGGHGFLQSSGFPEMITSYLQNPTVEGDNQMLPMQVVKILLKLVKDVQSGNTKDWEKTDAKYLLGPVEAMLNGEEEVSCPAESKNAMMDVNVLRDAYQHRAARLLVNVAQQIQTDVMEGKKFEDAWNGALIQMGRVSRAHSAYLLFDNFIVGIQEESGNLIGPNEVNALTDLALLFGLYWIEKEVGDFLEDGYLNADQAAWVRVCTLDMMDRIRPNAVALVDANDFSDFKLKSALGRFDGNVYPAILEASKKDPLNATEPGPGYEEHLKRLIVDGAGVYSGTASRL
jgi:acyl-CoA oxidase